MLKTDSVDQYILNLNFGQDIVMILRQILNSSELVEAVKWGIPTYTLKNKNVVALAVFKSHVALWFWNGVFLEDKSKVLINAQEGKTQGMRQWRFTNVSELDAPLILQYVEEAIENQKQGKIVKPRKKELVISEELNRALTESKELSAAFACFSLSQRREFSEHIGQAEKLETKERRLKKIVPMILSGVGLHDKYRK